MKRFFDDPEIVYRPTDLTARILREIATASEAGAAEVHLAFRQNWQPNHFNSKDQGLGVHIECGRADSFLLISGYPDTLDYTNSLPTVFDALAKLMVRAREPGGTVARQLRALLNEHDDDR